jgi:general secretion pathway protein E
MTTEIALADGLTRDYLLHHRVCPTGYADGGAVRISAAPDALLDDALDDLRLVYGAEVVVEPASLGDVERAIERLTTRAGRDIELARVDHDDERTADVRDLATQPPVVRFVNLLVRDAYDAGASDIHLESARSGLGVRFRLDGVLGSAPEPPAELAHAVVSRIKLLAELDIAERRRPQDGRIRVRLEDRELDLRVSTVPTLFGESVVLRLLDRGGRPVALVTGPTGSGKTTTLYSALQRRDTKAEKIITVEDPVEYELPGITQVPVHRQAGVTFAAALRSILRQDPDVVMLGEMRDPETAEVAVQAAMTGHVVFSTLHTNDAVSAIPRLIDLGVPPYLIAATLDGVLAQRLVRKICEACRGEQCPACRNTGYRGRLGLFELFPVDDEAKQAIVGGRSRADLTALARSKGMRTLAQDGEEKVAAGATTIAEVMRAADS